MYFIERACGNGFFTLLKSAFAGYRGRNKYGLQFRFGKAYAGNRTDDRLLRPGRYYHLYLLAADGCGYAGLFR